jgi:hypothetical protein
LQPAAQRESSERNAHSEARISVLEERLQHMQDQLDIYQLMSTYGPSADSGSGDVIETLFTSNGQYISGIPGVDLSSAVEIRRMIEQPSQREFIDRGCAHMVTMPVVRVSGDRAIALCHGQLLRHQDGEFQVWRTSASRWDFVRTSEGWKVARRKNELLDGNSEAQNLFREALVEFDT